MRLLKLWARLFLAISYIDGAEGGGGSGEGEGSGGGEGGGDELLAGKYKTQADLIDGYNALNTAFSGKDEAHKTELASFHSPEKYEAGEDWGNDNAMDNRMMAVLQEVGKEHNMPQGMYESIVNGMVEMQSRVAEEAIAETSKSIPNFDNRANAIADTALKYLRPDQAEGLDSLMTTKEGFEAVEILMSNLRGGGLPQTTTHAEEISDSELREQIDKLNPADSTKRAELMGILNKRGGKQGKMI